MTKRKDNDPEKDVDACDHVHMDDSITEDEDLPETNLVPGLNKPKAKISTKTSSKFKKDGETMKWPESPYWRGARRP